MGEPRPLRLCGPRWRSRRPPLALVSLFDGTGLARLAVGELLDATQGGPVLVQSVFAELDDDLATAVETFWERRARMTGCVPHRRIAADVWNLFRGSPCPLELFAQGLPQQANALLVAGSPCQNLTRAGLHAGEQGLCGPASVLYFSVPTVAWALQAMRPDVTVHVMVDNAASMLPVFRDAILETLGGLDGGGHLLTLDAGDWAAMPRRRHFFGTIPVGRDAQRPARRPPLGPWLAAPLGRRLDGYDEVSRRLWRDPRVVLPVPPPLPSLCGGLGLAPR